MIKVNLDKAKNIAHDRRREVRAIEFAPLDIEATIPSKFVEAESRRQAIRDKYSDIQNQIDLATDVTVLKAIVENL